MEEHPIIGVARDLQPLIRKHLEAGEERARLMPEIVKAAGEASLFRLYAPREVGGLEVLPSVLLAAEEAVSAADPAVGRYITNSLAACYMVAYLGEHERAEVFAEPDKHFGFSAAAYGQAIPCDGGYRVSGQ